MDDMLCHFSPPEQLHSDQGKQFESKLVQEICKLLQVKKTQTTLYHPQCNGMAERFNRTLLDMLATMVCLHFQCALPHRVSPFFLMFGRRAQLPLEVIYSTGQQEEVLTTEYA